MNTNHTIAGGDEGGVGPGTHPSAANLAALQADLTAAQDALARLSKNFEAYKKQIEEHKTEPHAAEEESLLKEILSIVYHLETAMDSATSFLGEKLRQT